MSGSAFSALAGLIQAAVGLAGGIGGLLLTKRSGLSRNA